MQFIKMIVFILFVGGLFQGCSKNDGNEADVVYKNGQKSIVKVGSATLDGDKFKYISLYLHAVKVPYAFGFITLRNIPAEIGTYTIEPRPYDTLSRRYILNPEVPCAQYITLDVDALVNNFRLIADHPVNEFKILEIQRHGFLKGTFSLAFERDYFNLGSQLIDEAEPSDTVIFENGNFEIKLKE